MFNRSLAPRSSFVPLISLMMAVTISTPAAFAQTTQFTYQGKLTDSGSVANGPYDFQFKLFDTMTVGTGTQQGSTQQLTNVTLTNGAFTVQLDFQVCASCFNGAARFLEISVKPSSGATYTTLSPRQQINSTPYALKSVNAATADGLSVACVNCITSSQIGSVNGSAVTGAVPVASVPAGSSNYIQNTTTQQASSNFSVSGNGALGGSLGIGTNNPTDVKLEAAGSVRIYPSSGPGSLQFRNRTAADYSQVVFLDNANTFRGYLGYIGSNAGLGTRNNTVEFGSNGTDISFQPNTNEVMRLSTNGNVGIGTNNPTLGRLHVFGAGVHGVHATSTSGVGVYGVSNSFEGVRGEANDVDHGAVVGVHNFGGIGVYGQSSGTGVTGKSTGAGVGVYGESAQFEGVRGVAFDVNHGGVVGIHNGAGIAVYGTSGGTGVFGDSTSPTGHGGIFRNTAGGIALEVLGTATVGVLQITGGSDLAEHFEIVEDVKPGMVVAIDPQNAGKLSIARGAYNRRAAGVISGAKNLTAGMVLPNLSGAKESLPVALSGRVWVLCDATPNPIKPGDLLTTSHTPGHAMKVTNHAKAQGAIIGKAMTNLKSGRGLVLVLVTLQ